MRDPELVVRAQLAASALEGAWHRWRVVHGDAADPRPAVSSYVGYSLHEPWGQPRVVFGLAADDAEQLAALIEWHGSGELAYVPAARQHPAARDLPARTGARAVVVPVPRQAPLIAANVGLGQSLADALLADENASYDEPLYRQAAAAMKEAAAARENASRDPVAAGRSNLTDLVSPEWIGSLAMAAFTAKAEAEARIRAALTKPDEDEPDDPPAGDEDDGPTVGEENSEDALPQVNAADALEPLPAPREPAVADAPAAEEPAAELDQDDVPDQDDHEDATAPPSDGPGAGDVRRGRVTRSHPIARLSKTKRPGAPSRAAGS